MNHLAALIAIAALDLGPLLDCFEMHPQDEGVTKHRCTFEHGLVTIVKTDRPLYPAAELTEEAP